MSESAHFLTSNNTIEVQDAAVRDALARGDFRGFSRVLAATDRRHFSALLLGWYDDYSDVLLRQLGELRASSSAVAVPGEVMALSRKVVGLLVDRVATGQLSVPEALEGIRLLMADSLSVMTELDHRSTSDALTVEQAVPLAELYREHLSRRVVEDHDCAFVVRLFECFPASAATAVLTPELAACELRHERCVEAALRDGKTVALTGLLQMTGSSMTRLQWESVRWAYTKGIEQGHLSLVDWVEAYADTHDVEWAVDARLEALRILVGKGASDARVEQLWEQFDHQGKRAVLLTLAARPFRGESLSDWCRRHGESMGDPVEQIADSNTLPEMAVLISLYQLDPMQLLPRLSGGRQREWCLRLVSRDTVPGARAR